MASIKQLLRSYQTETGGMIQQPGVSYGEGTIRRNLAAEAAGAQQKKLLESQVAMTKQESNLLDEQRKQASIQRDEEIRTVQKQSKQEKQRYQLQSEKILTETRMQKDRLSQMEFMDQMEIAASSLRLQDDKYRYEIADIGRKQRLNDALSFDYALKQAVFMDEIEMLKDNIAFKKTLDMKDAEFERWLAQMDVSTAIDLARSEAETMQQNAMYSAAGSTIATAADIGRSSIKGSGSGNTDAISRRWK